MAELRFSLAPGLGAAAASTAGSRPTEPSLVCVSSSLTRRDLAAMGGFGRIAAARVSPPQLGSWKSRGVTQRRRSPGLQIQAVKQTFSSFNDMITNSDIPVLVDFYATWCGPCQVMAPILTEVGVAMKDKIRVVKVDTEKYHHVASRYGISALPTLVLFVKGKPIKYVEGVQGKASLIEIISQTLESLKSNV